MSVIAVVGAQWGDEGKGRVVDFLAESVEMVIRFQGGSNAGHTVINDYGKFPLHMIPSGIFNPDTRNVVGTGCVVDPDGLLGEMATLEAAGVSLDNLWLSDRAHVVFPLHRMLDGLEDLARGAAAIGTTKRGVGPAYEDKIARRGVRLGDLKRPDYLRARLAGLLEHRNPLLERFGQPPVDLEEALAQALEWGKILGARIIDTLPLVRDAVRDGKNILLEGQLGVMRDLDWGTYPFVTSSNPTVGGACSGAGLPPSAIDEVVGVVKVYSTAVGSGPFPVELHDAAIRKHLTEGGISIVSTHFPLKTKFSLAINLGQESSI